jgi:cytochrome P450
MSPATHYALEAVRQEVAGVKESMSDMSDRMDRVEESIADRFVSVEESQGRHRTLFDQIRADFRRDFENLRDTMHAFMLQSAQDAGSTRTWVKIIAAILTLIAGAVITRSFVGK